MTYCPLSSLISHRQAKFPPRRALFRSHAKNLLLLTSILGAAGCATQANPPSAEQLASLPVVDFPNTPPNGNFILKLARGQPIPVRVLIKGSLLTRSAEQTLTPPLSSTICTCINNGQVGMANVGCPRLMSLASI